ncbi:hypothetical protein AB5L52_10055 [Streptomyces sp. CG4]
MIPAVLVGSALLAGSALLVGSALLAGSTAHATDIGWDLTRPSAPTAA